MRVILVSANTERLNMPTMPIGLGFVSAATRAAGHEVRFLDLMAETSPADAVTAAVRGFNPEVIGISVRNVDDQNRDNPRFLLEQVRPLVAACRAASAAGVAIVLGGAGLSIFPGEALAYLGADYGVHGDGEKAFVRLLECLAQRQDPLAARIPGVFSASTPAGEEPDWAPIADLSELGNDWLAATGNRQGEDLWAPVQSRRGCPNDCSYCSTRTIQGRTIRLRPPEAVVGEIERIAAAGFRQFYFVDNAFNMPPAQGLALCRLLMERRIKLRWRCILYPHNVSEELVDLMARAGCTEVSMGFESGSVRVLQMLNKHFTPAEVRQLNLMLIRHGIRRTGFLLLGAPGETKESVEESLAFAESLDLDALRITVGIRIYPGTPLARIAIEQGIIESEKGLLQPRFYLAPGLEPWIHGRVTPGMYTNH